MSLDGYGSSGGGLKLSNARAQPCQLTKEQQWYKNVIAQNVGCFFFFAVWFPPLTIHVK